MRLTDEQDVVVIGGGVVGLAIARALASEGRRPLVIERDIAAGLGGSSRSSGVIHAGLHHPDDWLKTTLARRGRAMLYAFCERHGVAHARSGKWIVASDRAELPALEALAERARVRRLTTRWLVRDQAREREPRIDVEAALQIEESGVVRSAELVRALVVELESMGGELLIGVGVERIEPDEHHAVAHLVDGPALRAAHVVVAAGLETDVLLARSGLDVVAAGLRQTACKGEWVALSERYRKSVGRHVYPLPHTDGAGLGVHLTRDVDGYLYAGPDVEWLPHAWPALPVAALTPDKVSAFGAALRRFMPDVSDDELHPMMAGLRTKLAGPGEPARDFEIWRGADHGWPGVTALLGIESPGLTACLALGQHVAEGIG